MVLGRYTRTFRTFPRNSPLCSRGYWGWNKHYAHNAHHIHVQVLGGYSPCKLDQLCLSFREVPYLLQAQKSVQALEPDGKLRDGAHHDAINTFRLPGRNLNQLDDARYYDCHYALYRAGYIKQYHHLLRY